MAAGELMPIGSTNRRHSGRGHADRLALGEKVLAKRNEGWTMPMICTELGISASTAERVLKLVLAVRVPPTVDEFRRQQNDRLDQTQRTITENMEYADWLGREGVREEKPALVREAINLRTQQAALQLRLDERRARLNGLDAPVKVEATVTQVDAAETELAAMVRETKARMAQEEESRG